MKYICNICGYVYDEALGDSDGGIDAGTLFDDLPDDWLCPDCGVDKTEFEKI
jgi:rubredoxin